MPLTGGSTDGDWMSSAGRALDRRTVAEIQEKVTGMRDGVGRAFPLSGSRSGVVGNLEVVLGRMVGYGLL